MKSTERPEPNVPGADLWASAAATPTDCAVTLMLGVPVDDVTMDESVDRIFRLVARGRRDARMYQVATVNVDFIVNALLDRELAELMCSTSLAIPDGMPVVWGSALLGSRLRTRVAGADLVPAIVARSAAEPVRILLYGAAPGVAAAAAELLREQYPGADVIGLPGPDFDDVADVRSEQLDPIVECDPDVCCVAFGNPKQERFIARFGAQLGVPVMIGIGGTLDFLVGEQVRAPVWMQRSGLEWLYRAGTERRLVRRYLRDARMFIPALLAQAWSGRASRRAGGISIRPSGPGRWILDLSALESVDNRTANEIASCLRSANEAGVEITVAGRHDAVLSPFRGLDGVLRHR